MKQAINQSIDQANPVAREAAEALSEVQKARKFYGRRMNNIATMEQEVLTSLGVHGKNAREVFGRVLSADPQQVRAANRLISRLQDGDTILSKMREGMIHFSAAQSVSNQAKATGKMTGDFNLADFLNNYATNSVRAVELGIMTPKQRELGQAGVKLARKILNSDQVEYGVIQTHNPLSLSNVLINAASRDPGFLSRMLGMVIEKGQGADWLFHSPQGIKTLTTLSDVVVGKTSSPAAQAAANSATLALLDIVGTTTVMESLNREEVEQEQ